MEYRLTKSHRCISIRPIAENKIFHAYKVWNEHFARRGFGPIWMVVYDGMYNLRAPGARPQKVLWHYAKFRKNDIEYFRAQNDRFQISIIIGLCSYALLMMTQFKRKYLYMTKISIKNEGL
jgi:hypothetical protein